MKNLFWTHVKKFVDSKADALKYPFWSSENETVYACNRFVAMRKQNSDVVVNGKVANSGYLDLEGNPIEHKCQFPVDYMERMFSHERSHYADISVKELEEVLKTAVTLFKATKEKNGCVELVFNEANLCRLKVSAMSKTINLTGDVPCKVYEKDSSITYEEFTHKVKADDLYEIVRVFKSAKQKTMRIYFNMKSSGLFRIEGDHYELPDFIVVSTYIS